MFWTKRPPSSNWPNGRSTTEKQWQGSNQYNKYRCCLRRRAAETFVNDIKKLTYKDKPKTEIGAIPRPPLKAGHWFSNKDEIPKDMQSSQVYQLKCSSWPATDIGETISQVGRRLEEHGAPTSTLAPKVLLQSDRIAATKKIAKQNGDFDSGQDCNGIPPVSSSNRRGAETTSAVHWHIKETNIISIGQIELSSIETDIRIVF